MKRKIIKKSVDSVKKRKTRRGFILNIDKIAKKQFRFEALCSENNISKKPIENSQAGLWQRSRTSMLFLLAKNNAMKLIAAFLIICASWLGMSHIGRTYAYFIDIETSQGNIFSAGTLDFSLVSPTENFIKLDNVTFNISLNSSGEATRNVTIVNEGSLPFDYYAGAENITGDQAFCADLAITASREGEIVFHGLLTDFIPPNSPKVILTGTQDEWNFQLDPAGNTEHPNKNCIFDLVFRGWQTGEEIDSGIGQFNDEEELKNSLVYAGIVLNEFLPNSSGSEAFGEWVEVYNNSNSNIDVAGWALYDSKDEHELVIDECFTHGESTIVEPKGFLVLYRKNKNECSSSFTLNNSKDTIRLYNGRIEDGGILIDSYSYDNDNLVKIDPTPNDGNDEPDDDNDEPQNNNKSQTDKSYARFPDGAGPWYDPIPTPGKPNILESEVEKEPVENPEHNPVKVDDDEQNKENEIMGGKEQDESAESTAAENLNENSEEENNSENSTSENMTEENVDRSIENNLTENDPNTDNIEYSETDDENTLTEPDTEKSDNNNDNMSSPENKNMPKNQSQIENSPISTPEIQ